MDKLVMIVHLSAATTAVVLLAACLVGWSRTQWRSESNRQRDRAWSKARSMELDDGSVA
ncbi:hypothetical protein Poly24_24000 [Rosistilla carotiformis]|uniref:Uncharacterized protein n=1 Tax=Rosistilla carotiformis TaxID=2528017 RepID=A0A518JT22_9BACT|nr:hypothetical protein Poly24_24000 [Rosistilla carotiformis]